MRKKIVKILKIMVTLGIFGFLYHKFDMRISEIFGQIQYPYWLLLGIFIRLVVVQGIAMNRWRLFLRLSGVEESIWSLTKISFISSFMGVVLPSSQGGDVMRMYFIEKKHPTTTDSSYTSSSTVIIERMIGFVLLASIGLISSIFIPDFPNKEKVIGIILLINLALWSVIFILINKRCYAFFSARLERISHFRGVFNFIEKTHRSLVSFPYRKVLLPSVVLIGLYQLSLILILYIVFSAFGYSIPFYQHMAFYPIIAILSIIPVSISGLGLREGFFVFFYGLIGVDPAMAVGISLVNYAIDVLSAVATGGIVYLLQTMRLIKV